MEEEICTWTRTRVKSTTAVEQDHHQQQHQLEAAAVASSRAILMAKLAAVLVVRATLEGEVMEAVLLLQMCTSVAILTSLTLVRTLMTSTTRGIMLVVIRINFPRGRSTE